MSVPSIKERCALLALFEAAAREPGRWADYFAVTRRVQFSPEESERVLAALASMGLVRVADLGNLVSITEAGASLAHELLQDPPDESGVRGAAGVNGVRRRASGSD